MSPTPSLTIEADSEEQTAAFGHALAAALDGGQAIALNGPLGAGKTRLVQAVVAGLGLNDAMVNSPTFVLVQEYDGPLPVYHVDAYRLRDSDEFLELGGDELLDGPGVCLIEWADRVSDVLPADHLRIDITQIGEHARRFELTAHGAQSAKLLSKLAAQ